MNAVISFIRDKLDNSFLCFSILDAAVIKHILMLCHRIFAILCFMVLRSTLYLHFEAHSYSLKEFLPS